MENTQARFLAWLTAALAGIAMALAAAGAQAREAPTSFADLAEKLLPSVVNISTTQTVQNPERMPEMPQFPPGSPFEDFFKEFFDRQRPDMPPRRATSLGSGFIVDGSGLVVTNNHVIADADEVTVILHDDTALKAEVLGRDAKTDLALLRINSPTPLPAVSWGDSDAIRVGDWVIAIGNPFGLGGTVTAGIISARARDINSGPYDDFLQTDASINRGNSGGPMFDMAGNVIGINTAIFSPSGGSIGIGFAIPSTLARSVVADLQKFGKTRRGWLGVRIQSVTDEIAESLGLKESKGALVASVNPGGPADKAGIKAGDVILSFDGREIGEMRRLPRMVAETEIGRKAPAVVWRGGKAVTLQVAVGELHDEDEEAPKVATATPKAPDKAAPGETTIAPIGVKVAALSPQLRQKFELPEGTKGVVVTEVIAAGVAAEKGIRAGDVVVEVGQEPVTVPNEFADKIEAARKAGRRSVLLLVDNGRGLRFVALRVDGDQKTGSVGR
ncbi:MAG: DegQ family serine endoprotease [Alphaproteobacteria bacterium]|nr:DegQ family serine endoprotease [Alphaproteobacteria bacterium]